MLFLWCQNASLRMILSSEDKPQNPRWICLDPGTMLQNQVPAGSAQGARASVRPQGRRDAIHLGPACDKEPLGSHLHTSQIWAPHVSPVISRGHCEPRTESGWLSTPNQFSFSLPHEKPPLCLFSWRPRPSLPLPRLLVCAMPRMGTQYDPVTASVRF